MAGERRFRLVHLVVGTTEDCGVPGESWAVLDPDGAICVAYNEPLRAVELARALNIAERTKGRK